MISAQPTLMEVVPTMKMLSGSVLALLVAGGPVYGQAEAPEGAPHPRAHAHNDYEHERPLLDALEHGFTSVEADIYLVDGALLIAHDPEDLDPRRTLRGLYLDPLQEIAEANGGAIYPDGAPLRLLIDVKTEAEPTWAVLKETLAHYEGMLTRFGTSGVEPGAVSAIVSGERAREAMIGEETLPAGYDGRFDDLNGAPAGVIPLLSGNWTNFFAWEGGDGEMPADQRAVLDLMVATAHEDGQMVRFWATPDAPGPERDALWRTLINADVDLINTDDLAGLQRFLEENGS